MLVAPIGLASGRGVSLGLPFTREIVYLIDSSVIRKRIRFHGISRMAKKKKRLGGCREGSGRKLIHPEGATVPVTVRVPATLIDGVDSLAAQRDQSRSEIVTEAVRTFLDAQKSGEWGNRTRP
jgi:hypothetical protein